MVAVTTVGWEATRRGDVVSCLWSSSPEKVAGEWEGKVRRICMFDEEMVDTRNAKGMKDGMTVSKEETIQHEKSVMAKKIRG